MPPYFNIKAGQSLKEAAYGLIATGWSKFTGRSVTREEAVLQKQRIPKILHYCFGFSSNFGYKPWSLVHYVCVKSAINKIKPERAYLYYEYEPSGPWWDLTKPLIELVKIKAPREIFGRPLRSVAHRADVVRLEKLIEYGGIYLDCDVLVHRNFDDLLDNSFVISQEGVNAERILSLSNAALLAEPSAPFAKRWYQEYRSFRGEFWAEHSTALPLKLARTFPDEVTVLRHTTFCWPLWYESHLKMIYVPGQAKIENGAYGNHLWETIAWEKYLENLTPRGVRITSSNFCEWARPLIADLPDDFGAPSLLKLSYTKIFNQIRRAKRDIVRFVIR
jgi:Glycosyltransferase sugar-binding region containing DXD motif